MSHLVTSYMTHSQRVCRLYKMAIKECRNYGNDRLHYRYLAILMRARFDQNKNVKDRLEARRLLAEGEVELEKMSHPMPVNFPDSPGGSNYDRSDKYVDSVYDLWHPLEKAQFPEFFRRRALRKTEYLMRWNKKYGKSEADSY
ncbi:hypothetical protein ACOME3_005687 [Neoechinorhynchus agilis]